MAEECPQCGSSDFETRRESDGRTYSYDSHCRACGHFWWVPGEVTLVRRVCTIEEAEREWTIGAGSCVPPQQLANKHASARRFICA